MSLAVRVMVAGVVALLSAAACGQQPGGGRAGGPLKVVATTGMVADAAAVVGGDRVKVTGLMGEGVDPHLYKASPGDVRQLEAADIILYHGLHLEGKMADALRAVAKRRPSFPVTAGITEGRIREISGQPDPHVWFDVSMWRSCVERVAQAYAEVDPDGKAQYEANAAKYAEELKALHEWCVAEIGRIPKESRVLVTAHDAFGYFGRAYDIEVLAIQGVSTDSEASIKAVNGLVDTIVSRKVKAVFVESSVPHKTIEALVQGCRAKGHSVAVGGELYSDALGKAGTPDGTYAGIVRHNVKAIVKALLGQEARPAPGEEARP